MITQRLINVLDIDKRSQERACIRIIEISLDYALDSVIMERAVLLLRKSRGLVKHRA